MPRNRAERGRQRVGWVESNAHSQSRFRSLERTRLQDDVLPLANPCSEPQMLVMKISNVKTTEPSKELLAKLESWVPQNFRFGSWSNCFYCGTQPTDRDHVIPFSMISPEKRGGKCRGSTGMTTPSCHECNLMLSNLFFETMHDRCEYVNKRIRRRYSKLLHMEKWQDWELDSIKGKLRSYVICKQSERNMAVDRASWQFKEKFTKLFEQSFDECKSEHPENKHLVDFMRPRWMEVAYSTAP